MTLYQPDQKKSFHHFQSEALLCVGRMEGRRNVVSSIVHSSASSGLSIFEIFLDSQMPQGVQGMGGA